MAVNPIYPQEQNFSTPLMATPNPEYGLRYAGMSALGQGLGNALKMRAQQAQAQKLAAAMKGGPMIPGMGGAGGMQVAPPADAPVSPQLGASNVPLPPPRPADAGPAPTPQQMTPPPPNPNAAGGLLASMGQGQSAANPTLAPSEGASSALDAIKSGIARVESGGNYEAVGPAVHGDHALGKYQVMGANVPSWTKEALGYSETPQQFLNDPTAQELVASTKMGEYLNKFGDAPDVASMWFTGKPASQSRGLSDGNMKAENYIAATVGGGNPADMPSPNAQNADFMIPGQGGGNFQINPQIQDRLSQLLAVGLSPYADPQTRQEAMQLYEQQMQFALPQFSYRPIPGTNNQIQIDRFGRPTGQVLQGGPMKYSPGDVLVGQNGQPHQVGQEWTVTANPNGSGMIEVNKYTGQWRPVQTMQLPDLPGSAPKVGAPSAAGGEPPSAPVSPPAGAPTPAGPQNPPAASVGPGMGYPALNVKPSPMPGTPPGAPAGGTVSEFNGLPQQIVPALGGNPGGNVRTPPGATPGVATGAQVAGNPPLQRGQFVLQPVEGEAYLDNLAKARPDLAGMVGEARAILRGDMPLPPSGARSNIPQQVIQMVYKANPNFSAPFAASRAAMIKNYNDSSTPNSTGGLILNANSALGHLGKLWQASQALAPHQSDHPLFGPGINSGLNAIWGELGPMFGGPSAAAQATYEANLTPFVQELTKFYEGSGGTETDREKMEKDLSPDAPPSARRAAMERLADLLQTKLGALQAKWHQGMGPNSPDYPMLDPESQQALAAITGAEGIIHMGSGSNPAITPSDRAYLRAHPEKAAGFDKKFGPGAAKAILGQ